MTFVLVHGAWHGGWAWRRVAPLLRAAGHDVHAPTLTGVSDRAHLLHPSIGLSAHVRDVVAGHYRESVAGPGFGWLIPVRSLAKMGVTDEADVAWLSPRLTPHPWLTFTEKLSLTGAVESVPAEFIECVDWMRVFRGQRERAAARGWPVHELRTGHEAMVTAPGELAELLLEIAR